MACAASKKVFRESIAPPSGPIRGIEMRLAQTTEPLTSHMACVARRAVQPRERIASPDPVGPAISRSLQRAASHLKAHPDSRCSAEDLARIAGVTLPTLRRNAKLCLGVPLARFIEEVRLTWAHERLKSPMENRSITELALASGYRRSTSFARSYHRLFDETPSRTGP